MTRIRLGVTFHSIFYAPFFVAQQRGLFAGEGLELDATMPGDGRVVLAGMERGTLDVGIGGVMRSMLGYDQGAGDLPIHFARINDRDGFFLLGHAETFDWPDLIGRRLALFSEAPTPWYVLRAHLLDQGLDPDGVVVLPDLPVMNILVGSFGQDQPTFGVGLMPTAGGGEIRLGDAVQIVDQ